MRKIAFGLFIGVLVFFASNRFSNAVDISCPQRIGAGMYDWVHLDKNDLEPTPDYMQERFYSVNEIKLVTLRTATVPYEIGGDSSPRNGGIEMMFVADDRSAMPNKYMVTLGDNDKTSIYLPIGTYTFFSESYGNQNQELINYTISVDRNFQLQTSKLGTSARIEVSQKGVNGFP